MCRFLRMFLPALAAAGWVACSRQDPPASVDATQLRGEKIQTVTATATATNPPAAAKSTSLGFSTVSGSPISIPGYTSVGFDTLAGYPLPLTDDLIAPPTNQTAAATARIDALIPKSVRDFDRQRVTVKGFMLPLKVEAGVVTELLILKDQSMCCYGVVPKLNEWISVKMTGGGVKPVMDQAVTLYGTLHVEQAREKGYLMGLYQMDGEGIRVP